MNRSRIASGLTIFALLMVVNVPTKQTTKPATAQNSSIERPQTSALCIPAQPASCRPTTSGLTETAR